VTGGAGFIGSVLVWKLNELGEKDILVVDQHAENSPKWANLKMRQYSRYVESDKFLGLLKDGSLDGKVKAVFHMGACSDTTEQNKSFLDDNNLEYTKKIALWCVANGAYLAYASSAATYGDGELGFSDDDKLTPKLKPLNLYGQSKLDFDIWALKNGYDKLITGFRFFNVYGPNEYHKGHMRSLAEKGYYQIRDTGKIKLFKSYKKEYPDGGQKRDFIYVKDVAEAMMWFYKNPQWKGIYNLGSGKAQSWNDLAEALFLAMGKPKNIEYVEMPDNLKNQYQYFTEADLTKLRSTGCPTSFGDLKKGAGDYVKNYLSKPDPCL
jgi:ADP-L-glycero-D-manno-heptose 6-epimerase